MQRKDAPKVMNVGVWSASIVALLVFSFSLVSYLSGGFSQISADTDVSAGAPIGTCDSGTMYTINNYPGIDNIEGGHASYYLEGDLNWRCSYVCVPQEMTLNQFLSGSTVGGQPINIVNSPNDFNALVKSDKQTAMTRTVIISQSTPTSTRRCTGPNSVDYGKIEKSGATIDTVERQNSSYKEPAVTEDQLTGADRVGGAGKALQVGTSGSTQGNTETGNTNITTKLKYCIDALTESIEKSMDKADPYARSRIRLSELKKAMDSQNPYSEDNLNVCRSIAYYHFQYEKQQPNSKQLAKILSGANEQTLAAIRSVGGKSSGGISGTQSFSEFRSQLKSEILAATAKNQLDMQPSPQESVGRRWGRTAGRVVGTAGGAVAGALGGAAAGTAILPGLGTLAGGVVGGVAGAFGGHWAGGNAGERLGAAAQAAGGMISSVASGTLNGINRAAGAVRGVVGGAISTIGGWIRGY